MDPGADRCEQHTERIHSGRFHVKRWSLLQDGRLRHWTGEELPQVSLSRNDTD